MSDDATGEKSGLKTHALNRRSILLGSTTLAAASALGTAAPVQLAQAQQPAASGRPPNILVIMGDDVGWFNIGAYHQGIMSGKTPNLDKLAAEGMRFTDYYAEASCTAGRANFITGQIPLRTGMTTVGQAGADVGIPDQAVTTATVLKSLGYATGQFGKNHLGDLNKYLPTVHGFDEFFGYLYHLDAMSDPYWFDYPQDWIDKYGPRNLVHCFATDTDDATVMPRWGKVGKQRIVDEGPLAPFPNMTADHQGWQKGRAAKYDMETFDDVLVDHSKGFMDKAKQAGKPFFIWHNTTRMHVFTYLSPKYQAMMNYESNYGLEEAGMAQLDNSIGELLRHLQDIGEADNTIVIFTTDNGAEVFTWPDGGMTPFRATKGTVFEGGFRVPCVVRWPGKIKPGSVENGINSTSVTCCADKAVVIDILAPILYLHSAPIRPRSCVSQLPPTGRGQTRTQTWHSPITSSCAAAHTTFAYKYRRTCGKLPEASGSSLRRSRLATSMRPTGASIPTSQPSNSRSLHWSATSPTNLVNSTRRRLRGERQWS
ncbi:MAG TPA: sulfatase-like hydrolase/transferase, partial [Xanthobacteraceae bacterium]|nr:sulfatase-like hydrolase/transferase [Xanthobacteraceae bacterium]